MRQTPSKFGTGLGPFRPIAKQPVLINLRNGGLNLDASGSQLEEGEATNAVNVRFFSGGVGTDYGLSAFGLPYAGAEIKQIMNVSNYEKSTGTKFLMRLRPTSWDRWNGSNWFTLPGALTGTVNDRYYTTTAKDTFLAANLVDRIKKWDGLDATAVADLSADAPIAKFITRVGTRVLAAVIKVGGVIDNNLVAWSADDLITDWTSANLGAGSARPPQEGSNRTANNITGLSTLSRGGVIYRQRTIQIAALTGVGSAPFRFTTVDFTHGTESPYSIATGGVMVGDFFLGYDYMVYNFDGNQCIPIGMPIFETLKEAISDRSLVVGAVDDNEQEYYLAYPSTGSTVLTDAWVFNIKEFARSGRPVWRRKTLPPNTFAFGYGFLGFTSDPIVNTITDIVNTISIRVDDWDNTYGPSRILFGDNAGQVFQSDKTKVAANGIWESKVFTFNGEEVTVDRVRLKYKAKAASTIAVAISTDGGTTYQGEKIYNLVPSAAGDTYATDDIRVTGRQVQFRLRPLTGYCVVTQIEATLDDRGRGNG